MRLNQRTFRSATRALAVAVATAGASFASLGQSTATRVVDVKIQRLGDTVTYKKSTTTPALVGYEVTVANVGRNVVNNTVFSAATKVVSSSSLTSRSANLSSSTGLTCSEVGTPSVTCQIGQIRPGAPLTFVLFFDAPAEPAVAATESVLLDWKIAYAEGGSDADPQSSRTDTQDCFGGSAEPAALPCPPTTVSLGLENSLRVKSALKRSGGTLYTGSEGPASGSDGWKTIVSIPDISSLDRAPQYLVTSAVEDETDSVEKKVDVDVGTYINGVFEPFVFKSTDGATKIPFTITLLRDAATLPPGTTEKSIVVYYGTTTNALAACGANEPNETTKRCIRSRKLYRQKDAKVFGAEAVGDIRIDIEVIENGRYIN